MFVFNPSSHINDVAMSQSVTLFLVVFLNLRHSVAETFLAGKMFKKIKGIVI